MAREPGSKNSTCAARPGARTAVVLAGGGALAAYEAGVLLYALDALPRETGVKPRLQLFSGTSAGALNVSFLAAAADNLAAAGRRLAAFWEDIRLDKILGFGHRELIKAARLVWGPGSGRAELPPSPRPFSRTPHRPVAGLFDTSRLRKQMSKLIPWARLQRHLQSGVVQGIALCATEVCTGSSVIFYQVGRNTDYRSGRDPNKEARQVRIDLDHAMASSAMPFLFPTVQINGVCYTDGALRQNTPLNPALRMGADRVLVVSLTQRPGEAKLQARLGCRLNPYPGALFLLGKTAGVFMSQSLDYELARVEMYNRLIAGGCEAYGPEFLGTLNEILSGHRNADYRPVTTCHIRPSESLAALALEALREAPEEMHLDGLTGRAVGKLLTSASVAESELLGYLMFTPTFTRKLISLGYSDAMGQREELLELLSG